MITKPAYPTSIVRPSAFFILTYLLSWIIWIPLDLAHFEIGPFHISESTSAVVRLLGVLVPAVSAMLLTSIQGGRPAFGALMRRLLV